MGGDSNFLGWGGQAVMGGQPLHGVRSPPLIRPNVGQPWWTVVGKITFYLDMIDNRYIALVIFVVSSVLVYLVWFYMLGS